MLLQTRQWDFQKTAIAKDELTVENRGESRHVIMENVCSKY